jgi:hypothetical protein
MYMPGGRPKSTVPLIDRFMARVEKQEGGCWHWMGAKQVNGYGSLSNRENWGTQYAHRWSYIHHKGDIPEGKMVRHTCDVRHCVNPEHLIPGDSVDNVRDMIQRNPHGCHRCFTPELIREIRAAYCQPPEFLSMPDLAKRYGVSSSTIHNIVSRKHYGYVE